MHDTEKDSYKIIGAWGGLDSTNGRAYTNLKKIGFFDKITPILTVYDEEHNSNDNITGSWTLKNVRRCEKSKYFRRSLYF